MRSEQEIRARLEWDKRCYASAVKYNTSEELYRGMIAVLEWVLEDTECQKN